MKKSLPVVLICALLLLWEACVRMLHVPLYVLPAPTKVIAALIGDIPTLARHAFISWPRRCWAWASRWCSRSCWAC